MGRVIISQNRMREILAELAWDKRVIAPKKVDTNIEYGQISLAEDILLSDELPYKSPKEFLFPQFEKIMTFEKKNIKSCIEIERETVLFGLKPCDTDALSILNKIFTTGAFSDPFFGEHLEKTIIIGMPCKNEKSGCFCKDREVDMSFSENCDIFLGIEENGYTVEHLSQKGEALLQAFEPEAVEDCGRRKTQLPLSALGLNSDIEEKDYFDKIDWQDKAEVCQGCGMCTYICPTCHCFEFKDIKKDDQTDRYRCWDSCIYPKFTLHASGHNPRNSIQDRFRQRTLHKYLYIKKNFGCTACTGCGRCIRSCPAGMNIKTVVTEIASELK